MRRGIISPAARSTRSLFPHHSSVKVSKQLLRATIRVARRGSVKFLRKKINFRVPDRSSGLTPGRDTNREEPRQSLGSRNQRIHS